MNQKEMQAAVANGIFIGGLKLSLALIVISLFMPFILPFVSAFAVGVALKLGELNISEKSWNIFLMSLCILYILFVLKAVWELWKEKKAHTLTKND